MVGGSKEVFRKRDVLIVRSVKRRILSTLVKKLVFITTAVSTSSTILMDKLSCLPNGLIDMVE